MREASPSYLRRWPATQDSRKRLCIETVNRSDPPIRHAHARHRCRVCYFAHRRLSVAASLNAPCSTAPCSLTWPPGSNWHRMNTAVRRQPTSSGNSTVAKAHPRGTAAALPEVRWRHADHRLHQRRPGDSRDSRPPELAKLGPTSDAGARFAAAGIADGRSGHAGTRSAGPADTGLRV